MIKYYCDICEQEINSNMINLYDIKIISQELRICLKCLTAIRSFIDTLKK